MGSPLSPENSSPVETLADALEVARQHWTGRPGAKVMLSRAGRCVAILGPETCVVDVDGPAVMALAEQMKAEGLSPRAVHDYLATLRTVARLVGRETADWPRAGSTKRKACAGVTLENCERAAEWLEEKGWRETADLMRLIAGTGLRHTVEVVLEGVLRVEPGEDYDTLHVAGRYTRTIPVVSPAVRAILADPVRMEDLRAHSHSSHIKRLGKAAEALGLPRSSLNLHAVRVAYARDVYAKGGGNGPMCAALLGASSEAVSRMVRGTAVG